MRHIETARYMTTAFSGGVPLAPRRHETPAEAQAVAAFWRDAGPARWFAKDDAFDRRFRERFLALHEAAARGELEEWGRTSEGALALLILLDQFPRNAFRGTPRMYATDPLARATADAAVAAGHDLAAALELRKFFYLPLAHSEDLADQARSLALCSRADPIDAEHARGHYEIVRRFGRFPHRNPILGRVTTPDEQAYLDAGGYAG